MLLVSLSKKIINERIEISSLVGGEFFAFKKSCLKELLENAIKLSSEISIRTEEQVLTILHAVSPFRVMDLAVYRCWTSVSHMDLPPDWTRFMFLHLPSEKNLGFLKLYERLQIFEKEKLAPSEFKSLVATVFPLGKGAWLKVLIRKIVGIVKQRN